MNKSLNTKLLSLTLTLSLAGGSSYAMNLGLSQEELDLHLLEACKDNDPQLIKTLLDEDANPNARTEDNLTALHLMAQHSKDPEMVRPMLDGVRKLLEKGADVNAMAAWGTPLHGAAMSSCAPLAMLLIRYNADVALCDSRNNTPHDLSLDRTKSIEELLESCPQANDDKTQNKLKEGYLTTKILAAAEKNELVAEEELAKTEPFLRALYPN